MRSVGQRVGAIRSTLFLFDGLLVGYGREWVGVKLCKIAWTYKKLILPTPSPSPTTPPQTKHHSLQTQLPLPTLHYKTVGGGRKGRSALPQTYSDPPKNMRKAVSLARLRYKRTHQPWSTWHDLIHHKSSLNHSRVFVLIIGIKSGQVFFCVLFIHTIIMLVSCEWHACTHHPHI